MKAFMHDQYWDDGAILRVGGCPTTWHFTARF